MAFKADIQNRSNGSFDNLFDFEKGTEIRIFKSHYYSIICGNIKIPNPISKEIGLELQQILSNSLIAL